MAAVRILTRSLISLVLSAGVATAAELDLNLKDETVRLSLVSPLGSRNLREGGATLDLGALLAERDDNDSLVAHLGLLVYGDAGAPRANVEAGIGVRAIALDADPDISGTALTVGGRIAARVPDFDRIGFHVSAFYAPGVTAFGELDQYLEYGAALDYQVIKRAYLYVGYRQLKVEVNNTGRNNLDTGFHGGFRLVF